MVMVEFSIVPVGKGESLSRYVARMTRIVRKSGVANRLTPMGTVLEGTWDRVFGVIRACARELEKDCSRLSVSIKADVRKGKARRMAHKVRVVETLVAGPRRVRGPVRRRATRSRRR